MALSDWNSICLPGIALLDCNDPIQVHHARTEISFRAKCTKSYLESGVPVARPLQNHPLRNLTQTLDLMIFSSKWTVHFHTPGPMPWTMVSSIKTKRSGSIGP